MEKPLDLTVRTKGKAQITILGQREREHFYASLLSSVMKLKQETSEIQKEREKE